MKKILAWLLFLTMLLSSAAAEEAFVHGAEELLESVNLQRDMLTLNIKEDQTIQAKLRSEDQMIDLTVDAGGSKVQIQILEDQIYVASDGTVVNLKYSDLADFASTLTPKLDMNALGSLFGFAATKFLLPHVQLGAEDGLHVSYAASGKELLTDAVEFLDTVFAEEEYKEIVDQLLSVGGQLLGRTLPNVEQLVQLWPGLKESMLAEEPDFHVAVQLDVDAALANVEIKGEIGSSDDLLLMDWVFARPEEGRWTLNGKLTERWTRSGTTRDYDINVDAEYNKGIWSLVIDYPSRPFNLKAEGIDVNGAGSFSLSAQNRANAGSYFMVQGNYAVSKDGLTALMTVNDRRSLPYTVSAVIGEKVFDISVTYSSGLKPFAVRILQDDGKLLYASFERSDRSDLFKGVYDGEKVILSTREMNVICTWAFESDHACVITLHPEFIANPDQTSEDAYVRLEYEGEEGNFTFTGRVIDPESSEVLNVQLICEPTEGIPEKLADAEQIIYLTPEAIQQLFLQ